MATRYTLESAHIFVNDLALAKNFYVETMGMTLIHGDPMFFILEVGESDHDGV